MEKNLEYYMHFLPGSADERKHLSLIQRDISGGRISKECIDSIKAHPKATEVSISGLKQDTFEHFVKNYAAQFKVIYFCKCPLIENLEIIESLDNVEYILFFWNQRATRLWDLSRTRALKGLAFDDFTRMHNLLDIAKSTSLEELHFGDKIWDKYTVDSLEPLRSCKTIRHLSFTAKKIEDERIEPIADLVNLESLSFSPSQFTTGQVAWLKAHLPNTVESDCLAAYRKVDPPLSMGEKNKDVLIIGKRKPFLDSKLDKGRVEKYVRQFDEMYRWFLANPGAGPEDVKI